MSTSTARRLNKITAALTPKEAVLVWMAEAHACGSILSYVDSLQHAPDDAYPLIRLGSQMEATVRAARRKEPEGPVWRAVRNAVRDAGFLYYLVSQLNFRALQDRRANWLEVALVPAMLHTVTENESPDQLVRWWEHAREAAHHLYVQQGTVQAIADRYFDGTSPLFPETATDGAEQVTRIERAIGLFNDAFRAAGPPRSKRDVVFPEPLDLAQIREAAAPAIQVQMALVVDLAKAEAWSLIGEVRESDLA